MFAAGIHGAVPGMGTAKSSYANRFGWGPQDQALFAAAMIYSGALDSGATPTTTLRAGLVMAQRTADALWAQYDPTATDGTQVAGGLLMEDIRMLDETGVAVQRNTWMMVAGPVRAGQLYNLDEKARGTMGGAFLFDDRLFGNTFGWMDTVPKSADYTVVNSTDNNKIFTTRGAGAAVNFTLPTTLTRGQRWRFISEADQNMTITAPANKLVIFNNLTATSGAFSTGGNLIGAACEVIVNDNATKYLFIQTCKHTLTVA